MFFTFTKSQNIPYPIVRPSDCPLVNCQCRQQARVKFLALEIFELPFLMLSCKTCTRCQRCDHYEKRRFSGISFDLLESWLFMAYIWLRTNIGALLFGALLYSAFTFYQDVQREKRDFLLTPVINDFYFVDLMHFKPDTHPRYRYTVLKVTEVDENKVIVLQGNMMHHKPVNARDHVGYDKPLNRGFFTGKTLTIPLDELTALYNKDVIYDVRRPRNLFIDGSIVVRYAADNT